MGLLADEFGGYIEPKTVMELEYKGRKYKINSKGKVSYRTSQGWDEIYEKLDSFEDEAVFAFLDAFLEKEACLLKQVAVLKEIRTQFKKLNPRANIYSISQELTRLDIELKSEQFPISFDIGKCVTDTQIAEAKEEITAFISKNLKLTPQGKKLIG